MWPFDKKSANTLEEKKAEADKIVAKETVKEAKSRENFSDMVDEFKKDHRVAAVTIGDTKTDPKRQKFLVSMMDRLPHFKYRDSVEIVLNSNVHFGDTAKMFADMEKSLQNPGNTTITRFEKLQEQYAKSIKEHYDVSQDVFIFNTKDFRDALHSINNTSAPLTLFEPYCALAELEMEYFKHICALKDDIKAANAIKSKMGAFSKN